MIFRRTAPADLSMLFDIRVAVKENIVTQEFLTFIGITIESLSALLETTHHGWLCEVDGQIVGFAIGNKSNSELEVIAVLPDHEGKGIGSRLVNLVQVWL